MKEPDKFDSLVRAIKTSDLNTSWVNELHEYDYWDIHNHSLLKGYFSEAPVLSGIARIGMHSNQLSQI